MAVRLRHRKAAPFEYHLGELLRGVDVERSARLGMNLALEVGDRRGEAAAQLLEDGDVEADPVALHRLEHRHERKLQRREHLVELLLGEAARQMRCDGRNGAGGFLGDTRGGRPDGEAATQGREVGGLARRQQVAGKHRVLRHRAGFDPGIAERGDQRLRVVTPHIGEVGREGLAQRGGRGDDDGDVDFGCNREPIGRHGNGGSGRPEQGAELGECDLAGRRHMHRLLVRGLSHLGEKGGEPEPLVQGREPIVIGGPALEGLEALGEGDVGSNADELTGELHLVPVLGERLAGSRGRDLVEVGVDLVDRAPSRDELPGALLADPGAPRDVVGAVAHQGEDLADPGRWDAEHLLDAALVEEPLEARVPHLHEGVPDELHEVLVGRGDDDLETGGVGPRRPACR